MKITIVIFKAFDKISTEVFYDKTDEQINEALLNICDTYEPLDIREAMMLNKEALIHY